MENLQICKFGKKNKNKRRGHEKISKKNISERALFQTFWRLHCCPDFLFIELDASNFGYLFIFYFAELFEEDWTTIILDILQGSPL